MQKPVLKAQIGNHLDNVRAIEKRKSERAKQIALEAAKPKVKTKEMLLFEASIIELDHRYQWTTGDGFLVTSMKFRHGQGVLKSVTRLFGPSLPKEGVEAAHSLKSSVCGSSITGREPGTGYAFHRFDFHTLVETIAKPYAKTIEEFDRNRFDRFNRDSDLWKRTISSAIADRGLEETLAMTLAEIYRVEAARLKGFTGGSVGWGHRNCD